MTGLELLAKLKESFSPDDVLDPVRKIVRTKTNATAEDVMKALADTGAPPGTIQKAQAFMDAAQHVTEEKPGPEAKKKEELAVMPVVKVPDEHKTKK